jgi:hypothetical protein
MMNVRDLKDNIGGVDAADLLRQQELDEPARRGGIFGGLQVRQVPPPAESPIEAIGPQQVVQLQSMAKGNDNSSAAGGPASPEGARKGEGTGQAGLSEGATGARRLEATNDPIRAKDAGETGKAKSASDPTDQIAQIMARVVELQKQLLSQVEQKPRNIEPGA